MAAPFLHRAMWRPFFATQAVCALVLLLVTCLSCTRGERQDAAPQPVPTIDGLTTEAPTRPAAADGERREAPADEAGEAWVAGRLPASVMAGTPRSGGELAVGLFMEPPSLNALVHADAETSRLGSLVYDRLVEEDPYDDPRYGPRPQLAERWDVSDDGLSYTFYLRRGVKWHDGKPFTATDVVATFDKLFDDSARTASMRSYFEELSGVDRLDDFTVRLRWKHPYFMVMDVLDDVHIMPAHIIAPMSGGEFSEAASNPLIRHPIGTGPFRFVRWQSGEFLLLERNERYWGRHAYLQRLRFLFVEDPVRRAQLAAHGDLDLWERPTEEQWRAADDPFIRASFHRSLLYPASFSWFGWNARRPMFKDRRVRRAMTMLLDLPRLSTRLHDGLLKPAACHFYWTSPACAGIRALPHDPAQAETLLAQAGWVDHDGDGVRDKDGRPFRFTLSVPTNSSSPLAIAAQDVYHRHGIELEILPVDWSVYVRRLREGAFDACWLQWTSGVNADPTDLWHSKSIKAGSNFVAFSDPAADKLIERARVMLDEGRRNAAFQSLGEILAAEQPVTLLFTTPRLTFLHRRVHGAHANLLGWRFQDFWVEGERLTRAQH